MCDFVPGSLLLCCGQSDVAATNLIDQIGRAEVSGVTLAGSMRELFEQRGAEWPKAPELADLEVCRLQVPVGSEALIINELYGRYVGFRGSQTTTLKPSLAIGPNLTGGIPRLFGKARPEGARLRFTELHAKAKAAMHLPVGGDAGGNPPPIVAIVDSGIANDVAFAARIGARQNFADERPSDAVGDELGHGTAIASIIHDLVPHAQIGIRKVVGEAADVSEWNVIAGLIDSADSDVIQTNVVFGGGGRKCRKCGRRSDSSVPVAFSYVVRQLMAGAGRRPVIVAPVGNAATSTLSYPARLAEVVAVGSMNSRFELSDFSNYGRLDEQQRPHENYYVLMGGNRSPTEFVSYYEPDGPRWSGTCFAAAYAAGFIASMLGRPLPQPNANANAVPRPITEQLRDSRRSSHALIAGFDERKHGRGYLCFS